MQNAGHLHKRRSVFYAYACVASDYRVLEGCERSKILPLKSLKSAHLTAHKHIDSVYVAMYRRFTKSDRKTLT